MTQANDRPRLVLASQSPRRRELLQQAGYEFEIHPSQIDEDDFPADVMPVDLALRLARMKSFAVATAWPDAVVLGADTVVAFGDRVLGKPVDARDAHAMLRLLSGTTQIVITGVAVTRRSVGWAKEQRVMSAVRMRKLTEREIEMYVESGGWRGKAGGYGIQDNDPFVTRLTGCYTNIVGLPMTTTKKMLEEVGVFPKVDAPGP